MKVRRLFAYRILLMRTVVYVDGFNLYYRALRKTKYKWLNLQALCEASLPKSCNIVAINYYTARVSGGRNPASPKDQNVYLKALGTLPKLHIHFGNFQVTDAWMPLVQPLRFWPPGLTPFPIPDSVCVAKTEEKGSDVNLGAHLVRDAFMGVFDHAVIMTNDTDLKEPLRLVVEEVRLPATLLTPVGDPAVTLKKLATDVRHLGPYLGVSQFPDPVIGRDGKPIAKPVDW
ncbi:MAG: NYN domain-containing protein [Terracidiphilus sp.]|jgi:uncharacterized LabA/DUF88 family protein